MFDELYDPFKDKVVGDFCCGTGLFSIAAHFFGPKQISAVDICPDALKDARKNFEKAKIEVECIEANLMDALKPEGRGSENVPDKLKNETFDTIVMCPPLTPTLYSVDLECLITASQALKPSGQVFCILKFKHHGWNNYGMTKDKIF